MTTEKTIPSFALYRWSHPDCRYDYPFIAVAEDRSVVLSLGDSAVAFEWGLASDVASALVQDFAQTGDRLFCDFAALEQVFGSVFPGGVRSGLIRFDKELRPRHLELSLNTQIMAEDGPEYLIQDLREYQRLYREPVRVGAVTLAERAMLTVCAFTFAELGARHSALIQEPPPPRFRTSS